MKLWGYPGEEHFKQENSRRGALRQAHGCCVQTEAIEVDTVQWGRVVGELVKAAPFIEKNIFLTTALQGQLCHKSNVHK